MADKPSPRAYAGDLADQLVKSVGPFTGWAVVGRTPDGHQYVVSPDDQAPPLTYDLLVDAAHALACSGCENCRAAGRASA